MNEIAKIGTQQLILILLGAAIFILIPILIAVVWKIRKKEPFSTILIGAATFLIFAIVLEKPLQAILIAPTAMGLKEHAFSSFVNARPLLWSVIAGLFPGIFEETGRFIAYKTLLKNRKNRETSISHGIGHGCVEVIYIMGITYITNIVYVLMINSGEFTAMIDQVKALAPQQADQMYVIAGQLAAFSAGDLILGLLERVFAVLFHIGASILVFYACRDKKHFGLYPLAIALHTAMDFTAALYLSGTVNMPMWVLEVITALFGIVTFACAYVLLYRKDSAVMPVESPSSVNT